jgi:hypothetical protein
MFKKIHVYRYMGDGIAEHIDLHPINANCSIKKKGNEEKEKWKKRDKIKTTRKVITKRKGDTKKGKKERRCDITQLSFLLITQTYFVLLSNYQTLSSFAYRVCESQLNKNTMLSPFFLTSGSEDIASSNT